MYCSRTEFVSPKKMWLLAFGSANRSVRQYVNRLATLPASCDGKESLPRPRPKIPPEPTKRPWLTWPQPKENCGIWKGLPVVEVRVNVSWEKVPTVTEPSP